MEEEPNFKDYGFQLVMLLVFVLLIIACLFELHCVEVETRDNTMKIILWCEQVHGIEVRSGGFCEYCAEEFLEVTNLTKKDFPYRCARRFD